MAQLSQHPLLGRKAANPAMPKLSLSRAKLVLPAAADAADRRVAQTLQPDSCSSRASQAESASSLAFSRAPSCEARCELCGEDLWGWDDEAQRTHRLECARIAAQLIPATEPSESIPLSHPVVDVVDAAAASPCIGGSNDDYGTAADVELAGPAVPPSVANAAGGVALPAVARTAALAEPPSPYMRPATKLWRLAARVTSDDFACKAFAGSFVPPPASGVMPCEELQCASCSAVVRLECGAAWDQHGLVHCAHCVAQTMAAVERPRAEAHAPRPGGEECLTDLVSAQRHLQRILTGQAGRATAEKLSKEMACNGFELVDIAARGVLAAFHEAEHLLDACTTPSDNHAAFVFDELVRTWHAEVPSALLRLLMGAMDTARGLQSSPGSAEVARRLLRADLERARHRCRDIYAASGASVGDDG